MAKTSIKSTEAVAPRRRSTPRTPSRGRGVLRYGGLLDATEALLNEHSPDDVGLYQIAERANVPPASVYHFFPTKDAAFLALAQRYLEGFGDLMKAPVPASALGSWQALLEWDQRQAMGYYNLHRPALKLFYGGYGGLETRQADAAFNARVGGTTSQRFDQAFRMPFLREPEKMFHIVVEIMDAVWAISYLRYDEITEDYFQEALAACVAYCRLYLPERLELRDEHREALARGENVVLTSPQGG
jgi:AcrR family transcriptional regulator